MNDYDYKCNCCGRPMERGWCPVSCDIPNRGQCIDCGYCVEHCQCENREIRRGEL